MWDPCPAARGLSTPSTARLPNSPSASASEFYFEVSRCPPPCRLKSVRCIKRLQLRCQHRRVVRGVLALPQIADPVGLENLPEAKSPDTRVLTHPHALCLDMTAYLFG